MSVSVDIYFYIREKNYSGYIDHDHISYKDVLHGYMSFPEETQRRFISKESEDGLTPSAALLTPTSRHHNHHSISVLEGNDKTDTERKWNVIYVLIFQPENILDLHLFPGCV